MVGGIARLGERLARWPVLPVAAIVLVTVALRAPLLDVPFERDEGEYAYVAWRLGYDELPYRDWVDQKPPGIFWVYRVALNLPLEPVRAVHLVAMSFSAASACALFFLARHFTSAGWAVGAAALFALLSAHPLAQGTAANTELFMLLPLVLSQLAFVSLASPGSPKVPLMLLAGAWTGIAVAFKQVAAVNWLLLVASYPFLVAEERRLRGSLLFAGWCAAGGVAVWGLVALYFFLRDGLGDLIHDVFTHNLEYIRAIPWSARALYAGETLSILALPQALVWVLSAVGVVATWMRGRQKTSIFLAGWLVTSLAGVSASGQFFPHYFQQMLPPLALAAVCGAEALCAARFWGGVAAWRRAAVLGLLLASLPAITFHPFLFSYTPAEVAAVLYPGSFFDQMPALGRRLAEVTDPEDRVFVFGAEPEVLFYARRASATRYIFLFPLFGPYTDARERQLETAREVAHARPAAALYLPNDLFFLPGSDQYFTEWSRSYLEENFRADTFLTVDASGAPLLVSALGGRAPSPPEGHQTVGALLVRARPLGTSRGSSSTNSTHGPIR